MLIQDLWDTVSSSLTFFDNDTGFTEELREELFKDDGSHYESKRLDGVVTKLF